MTNYFETKACRFLSHAGGNPDDAGALARWAQEHHGERFRNDGVVVAKDGTLVAETRQVRDQITGVSARYVTTAVDAARRAVDRELGLALGGIAQDIQQPVVHVVAWELTRGHETPEVN